MANRMDRLEATAPLPPMPKRTTPLRAMPDPAVHERVPRSEIGVERNWKEDQPGPDHEGRWLMMPVFGTPGNRQGCTALGYEKIVRILVYGRGDQVQFKRWIKNQPPAQMSAAEYWQWMRENEAEIDCYRMLGRAGVGLDLDWKEFWDGVYAGKLPEYQEKIAECRKQARLDQAQERVLRGCAA